MSLRRCGTSPGDGCGAAGRPTGGEPRRIRTSTWSDVATPIALHAVVDAGGAPWQGCRQTSLTTHPDHPCARRWPDGHRLGHEHVFVGRAADILRSLAGESPVIPMPDLADACLTERVTEATLLLARERTPITVADVR